jgi:hypothetical protein
MGFIKTGRYAQKAPRHLEDQVYGMEKNKIGLEEGIRSLYQWYLQSLEKIG